MTLPESPLLLKVFRKKSENLLKGASNHWILHVLIKQMTFTRHGYELVRNTLPSEFPVHENGLFNWNVSIAVSVQKKGRREISGHVADGAKWIKGSCLLIRIEPDHLKWPEPLLAGIEIKAFAGSVRILRKNTRPDCLSRLLSRHERLAAVERVRTAIPIPGDVPVTIERYDRLRTRVQSKSGKERHVSPR